MKHAALTILLLCAVACGESTPTEQEWRLSAVRTADADGFGADVYARGNTVVVSARPRAPEGGAPPAHELFIYRRNRLGLVLEHRLMSPEPGWFDSFGNGVAVGDDFVAVSSWTANAERGRVVIYERSSDGRWSETFVLEGEHERSYLGSGLAATSDTLIVGTSGTLALDGTMLNPTTDIYRRTGQAWSRSARAEVVPPVATGWGSHVASAGARTFVATTTGFAGHGLVEVYEQQADQLRLKTLFHGREDLYAMGGQIYALSESRIALVARTSTNADDANNRLVVWEIGSRGWELTETFEPPSDKGRLRAASASGDSLLISWASESSADEVQLYTLDPDGWRLDATFRGEQDTLFGAGLAILDASTVLIGASGAKESADTVGAIWEYRLE